MARGQLILSMAIFGTIGIFVQYIPLPSATIVMVRAIVGALFVGGVMTVTRQKLTVDALKRNTALLIASGIALGMNWALLFESYRHTTVAVATLCYYMAPVFMILLSPVVLKEPLTSKKILCALIAIIGVALVSGTAAEGISTKGVLLALGGAVLYCAVCLMNMKMQGLAPMERTFVQLAISAMVITPYALASGSVGQITLEMLPMLAVVGIVHTGIAYTMYFSVMTRLPSQTVAMFSYLDPITAVLLSALLLGQPMSGTQALGAVLVLGASFISEFKKKEE